MKNVLQALLMLVLLYYPVQRAHAQLLPHAAISINASTSGAGVGCNTSLNRKWALTGEMYYLQLKGLYAFAMDKFPVTVQPNTKIGTLFFHADYYPFAGKRSSDSSFLRSGLRLSAGMAFRNNPTYEGQFRLTESYSVGNLPIDDRQRGYVQTLVTTPSLQPYAGIGYDLPLGKYIGVGVEAGVYYHGKPKVDMVATGMLVDIALNEEQLEKNLSPFRWFPQVGVKFNYALQNSK